MSPVSDFGLPVACAGIREVGRLSYAFRRYAMTSEEVFAGVLYEMLTGRRFGRGTACIWRVSGQGGMPEVLVPVGEGEWAHGPQMLPGGDAILFTVSTT